MAVYDKNGNELSFVYDKNGSQLAQAYDKDGNPLIEVEPVESNFVAMSYNIQWFIGRNGNETMQTEIFSKYNANIIGFQEFRQAGGSGIPAMATQLLSADYPYIEMGNYGNKNAFASKYVLSDFTTVPHTTQTMDGQSYSTAIINFGGKEIFIVVSHVTTTDYESVKIEQVKEVFDALQGHDYFILMADFNTRCDSINHTEYTTIMKQFVDAGYNIANCSEQFGFNNTWTSSTTESGTWYPCDTIITSGNIDITNVVFDTTKFDYPDSSSIDHIPVVAYLKIN